MRIKIYDKDFVQLTTLVNTSSISDFNNLTYKNQVNNVGDASFVVRIDNPKITSTVINHYNKLEITDDDGTVRFVGVIVEKKIDLDLITVKCYGLAYILDRRITSPNEAHNGQANTEATSILNATNSEEATGITAGTLNVTTAVNVKFNHTKRWQAIKTIADSVGAQIIVKNDRKLYMQTLVGQDLSASVFFRYEKSKPQQANVLQFEITDDGKNIVSESHGTAKTFDSEIDDAVIRAKYGLLEEFGNFGEANDQTTLDNLVRNNNQDSGLSPAIALSPEITDNFDAGDVVQVTLDNGFISVDLPYQIFEKSVKIVNNQKLITIKLNLEQKDFLNDFKKMKSDLELLSRLV